jgi:hypothetical protein
LKIVSGRSQGGVADDQGQDGRRGGENDDRRRVLQCVRFLFGSGVGGGQIGL